MTKKCHQTSSYVICFFLIFSADAFADDFPQWRGLNRDGVLNEQNLLEELPEGELPKKWSIPIGSGYSGPTVADGRVYVTDRGIGESDNQVERILCINADTGEQVWEHSYEVNYNDDEYNIGYMCLLQHSPPSTHHGDKPFVLACAVVAEEMRSAGEGVN